MNQVVAFESFGLVAQGPTIDLTLAPSQSMAIVGPAASGKSRLIQCVAGAEKPAQGAIHVMARPAVASRAGFSKRTNPQSILRHSLSGAKANHAAEALTACGLWEHRKTPISQFSPSQLIACELLVVLGVETRLMVIDGQLDALDPWTLSHVMGAIRKRTAIGGGLIAVTNRPDLLGHFDLVVVLDSLRPVFSGTVEGLLKHGPKAEIQVESNMQHGVRALIEPFRIGVEQQNGHVVFRADKGQELAAKLLLEGYGDVEFVVVKETSPEQALLQLAKPIHKTLRRSHR